MRAPSGHAVAVWVLDNPRRLRWTTRAPTVLLGLLLVGGCIVRGPAVVPPAQPTPAPSAAVEPTRAPESTGPSPIPTTSPTPRPSPSPAGKDVSVRVTRLFVAAWARPDLDREAWYAGVTRYTTAGFGATLASVDPTSTPKARLVEPPRQVEGLPVDSAAWLVPLSDGSSVQVTCLLVDGSWKVAGVLPGDGE